MGYTQKSRRHNSIEVVPVSFSLNINTRRIWHTIKNLGRSAQYALIIASIIMANLLWLIPGKAQATAGTCMFALWDTTNGTTLPSNWTAIHSFDGYFPYGDSLANFGTETNTATRPYTPTTASVTITNTQTGNHDSSGNGTTGTQVDAHPAPTISYTAESNGDSSNPDLPAFVSLELIAYNYTGMVGSNYSCSSFPTSIQPNIIVFFDGPIPAGFSAYTPAAGRLIELGPTFAQGGGDNETTQVTVPGLASSTTTANPQTFLGNQATAPGNHQHAPPSQLQCTTGCGSGSPYCSVVSTSSTGGSSSLSKFNCTSTGDVPPYVQPTVAIATSTVTTISLNFVTMFSGEPGAGWSKVSESSGTTSYYYHQFVRPNTTANLVSQGSLTHSMVYQGTSGPCLTTANAACGNAGSATALTNTLAAQVHTHTYVITTNAISNVPPSVSMVFAQKVNFTLNAYYWFVDNATSPDATDPWPAGSALDIAQDTQLPAVPAPFQAPTVGTQLRLMIQILVNGESLGAGGAVNFALQYRKTTDNSCTNGSWTSMTNYNDPSPTDWTYGHNSVANDPTNLQTPTAYSSHFSPASAQLEVFSESNTTGTTPNAASAGQTIEYQFLIQDYSAATGAEYHIRPVEIDNIGTTNQVTIPLTLYQKLTPATYAAECPDIITAPGTNQDLRHGEFFLSNGGSGLNSSNPSDSDEGFTWAN